MYPFHLGTSNDFTVGSCVQVHIIRMASLQNLVLLFVTLLNIIIYLGGFTGAVKPFDKIGIEV